VTARISRRRAIGALAGLSAAAMRSEARLPAGSAKWRLATFRADVTPQLGMPQYSGAWTRATAIDDRLWAKGVVLVGAARPIVLVSVDWCEIRNEAYERWRDALADAASTSRDRVLVSSVHQHDTPLGELRAQRIVEEHGIDGRVCDLEFHERSILAVAAALRRGLDTARPVTHYGVGQAKVDRVASTRRVVLPGGRVTFGRYSRTTDPLMHDLPEGEIDPWLKTLSFWEEDRALAALSAYATHPMSNYGGGRVSCDFVGLARERREQDDARVHQVYFSGCSGDVTAGKYNDGSSGHRARLADRLYGAMTEAWKSTERRPLDRLDCRAVPILLPHRQDAALTAPALERTLADTSLPFNTRATAALGLSSRARNPAGHAIDVQAIDLGGAHIVLFPAEAFVAYQRAAQAMKPGSFVMALGYGECAPGYIPTKKDVREGFVREHGYCWVADDAEEILLRAVKQVLG
jgi:hypothetical protein